MATITIKSVLGGQGPTTGFAREDQFRASIGIDPAQPIDDLDSVYSTIGSGYLRPAASQKISGTTIGAAPLWMIPNPKDTYTYVYDALGSAYTIDTANTITALSDAGALTGGRGNGAEYNDNYLYFMLPTDVARYGPLNGVPTFNPTYWTVTLAKAALTNTTYPTTYKNGIQYPNHVAHRHSDGKMYFADVVGNQGALHYIATTKSSVEGDTDNSSTMSKLLFGYGLWPMAIESYGSGLAIALIEYSGQVKRDPKAKLALWDTTATNFNQMTWVEYPDPLITAVKNGNGSLYCFSGNFNSRGFRVLKYLGGYSFEEVYYSETGEPPLGGAVDILLNQILVGTHTNVPESDGCVVSIGLQKGKLGGGTFNIMRATGGNSSTSVTALLPINDGASTPIEMGFYNPTIGWTKGSGTSSNGIDQQQTQYNNAPSVWWSRQFNIGVPFNIDRIRIPLAQAVAANMTITPTIYFDNGIASKTCTVINNTNFPSGERVAKIQTDNTGNVIGRGENSFWLELKWTGSALLTVALPIEIDISLVPE